MYKIGELVKIKNTNLIGQIIRINNANLVININNKAVTINKEEVLKENESHIPKNKVRVTYDLNTNSNFNNKIMLRHKTKEEAIIQLDLFIDHAMVNSVDIIHIIHGKSGGILREAVHEYLKNDQRIESFKLGGYFEGQFGVTIAKLK